MKKVLIVTLGLGTLFIAGCSTNQVKNQVIGNMGEVKVVRMTSMRVNDLLVAKGYFHNVGTKPAQGYYRCLFYDVNKELELCGNDKNKIDKAMGDNQNILTQYDDYQQLSFNPNSQYAMASLNLSNDKNQDQGQDQGQGQSQGQNQGQNQGQGQQNSYIYNKYFSNEMQNTVEGPRIPKTLLEYRDMLIQDLIQKQKVKQIKSTKLIMPTTNINFSPYSSSNMNKLFNFSNR